MMDTTNTPSDLPDSVGGVSLRTQIDTWMMHIHWMKLYATEQGRPLGPQLAAAMADAESAVEHERNLRDGRWSEQTSVLDQARRTAVNQAAQRVLVAHGLLAELVRPATPDSIRWSRAPKTDVYGKERRNFLASNIGVGLAAMLVAVLAPLLTPAGSKDAAGSAPSADMDVGRVLNLIACGALGASFYNLYWIHHHLVRRTFDRVYVSSYYVRYALGIVAGFILGYILYERLATAGGGVDKLFSVGLTAVLGGFAAEAVHDVLIRLTETLKTLINGRGDDVVRAERDAAAAEARRADLVRRAETARELAAILASARSNGTPEATIAQLQAQIDAVLGLTPPPPGQSQ